MLLSRPTRRLFRRYAQCVVRFAKRPRAVTPVLSEHSLTVLWPSGLQLLGSDDCNGGSLGGVSPNKKKRIGARLTWKALRNGGLSTCSPLVATRDEVKCETEREKQENKTKKNQKHLFCVITEEVVRRGLWNQMGNLFGVDVSRPASSTGPAAQSESK